MDDDLEDEFEDYYENPPCCGNCKSYPCVDDDNDDLIEEGDGEFEDRYCKECCEEWEPE